LGGDGPRGEPTGAGASLPTRLAALGLAAAAADLGSVYIKSPLGPLGVTVGDWITTVGAYAVLALYLWVASGFGRRHAASRPGGPAGGATLLFLLATVTYALGTGVHLAANSIHDMLEATGGRDPWLLAYFWDETASHYMVDAARVGFAVSLLRLESRGSSSVASTGVGSGPAAGGALGAAAWTTLGIGAIAYGFIYFATAVEGQTVPLALPSSMAFAAWGFARSRRSGGQAAPARSFFTVAAIVSVALFAIWGIWQGGFPEFTKTGLIP